MAFHPVESAGRLFAAADMLLNKAAARRAGAPFDFRAAPHGDATNFTAAECIAARRMLERLGFAPELEDQPRDQGASR
jgi:hypothetical protein